MSIAESARRVAVLGIKTERQRDQPAYFVAEYLQVGGRNGIWGDLHDLAGGWRVRVMTLILLPARLLFLLSMTSLWHHAT